MPLRMAKARLHDSDPTLEEARLLAQIQQLYAQLRALPAREQPEVTRGAGSPAYQAIASVIRQHAERHWLITTGVRIGDTGPKPYETSARTTRHYFRRAGLRALPFVTRDRIDTP